MRNIGLGLLFAALCSVGANELGSPAQNCCVGQTLILAIRGENAAPFYEFASPTILHGEDVAYPDDITGFIPEYLGTIAVTTGLDIKYFPLDVSLAPTPGDIDTLVHDLIFNGTIDGHI
eukprot:7163207-Pyramimonas_sp.AAC.1